MAGQTGARSQGIESTYTAGFIDYASLSTMKNSVDRELKKIELSIYKLNESDKKSGGGSSTGGGYTKDEIDSKLSPLNELHDQVESIDKTSHVVNWTSYGSWNAQNNTEAVASMWRSADKGTLAQMVMVNAAAGGWAGNIRYFHGDPNNNRVEAGAVYETDNKFNRYQISVLHDGVSRDFTFSKEGYFSSYNAAFGAFDAHEHEVRISSHQEVANSDGHTWRMGGKIKGWWNNDGTSANLSGFNMYWRDDVGHQSSTVVECWSYGVRKDWGMNFGDQRLFSPAGNVAQEGSDERLKENITDAKSGALDRINQIEQKEFNWKEAMGGARARGFIAQQLEQIDPLYVTDSYNSNHDFMVKNVNTFAVISDLIGAIKELKQEVEELKNARIS